MMVEWALTNVAMTASPLEADQHIQTHELDIIHSMMLMIVMVMIDQHIQTHKLNIVHGRMMRTIFKIYLCSKFPGSTG